MANPGNDAGVFSALHFYRPQARHFPVLWNQTQRAERSPRAVFHYDPHSPPAVAIFAQHDIFSRRVTHQTCQKTLRIESFCRFWSTFISPVSRSTIYA